eukprot:CAMPEP_0197073906 /NCGR_PEP_ID=MMETSP1384-20130603/210841_1 /TAXON_ID=29189 /ORGANISM="Ammonia sp." /LENGTH=682 /DNA_ID=CAMNT_0042512747 /DNA_START=966 /DNA_END=3013 /DNA_ORIENTATION=-
MNTVRRASVCLADYMELGASSSCALLTSQNDAVKCFGRNREGQLGQKGFYQRGDADYEMGIHLAAIDFGSGFRANFLSPSLGFHRCVISDTNETKCIGDNDKGQLGYGDNKTRGGTVDTMGDFLLPLDLGDGFVAQQVVCGGYHTCALSVLHSVKCWGNAASGQLGYGDTMQRGDGAGEMGNNLGAVDLGTGFVPIGIAAGNSHNCVWSVSGTAKCFGYNAYGQLGQGDTAHRGDNAGEMGDNLTTIDFGSNFDTMQRGDGAGEMGNNLGAVDLGTGFVPIGIAAGESHTCVWSLSGTAKCFGWNYFGQLGQGDTANRGDGGGEMGDNLPTIDFGSNFFVVQICGGYVHTCALSSAGAVKCVGRNGNGQLGIESRDDIGDAAGEMGENLQAVDLGTNFIVIAIACGYEHSCALSSVRSIKCWGINTSGQLGYGDTVTRGAWGNTMGAFLNAVDVGSEFVPKEVKCGLFHTCTTSEDDQMKCWGSSSYGQLGYEDTEWRGDSSGEMGDNLSVINLLDYTFAPTTDPTAPTKTPSAAPTTAPSAAPSAAPPTTAPSATPTSAPSAAPTTAPSATPTSAPSAAPTTAPSATPTTAPSAAPSAAPTTPTTAPTAAPTTAPSATPTAAPTTAPTTTPSAAPTGVPSAAPTEAPVFISTEPNASTSAPHSALIFLSAIICVLSMVFLV